MTSWLDLWFLGLFWLLLLALFGVGTLALSMMPLMLVSSGIKRLWRITYKGLQSKPPASPGKMPKSLRPPWLRNSASRSSTGPL